MKPVTLMPLFEMRYPNIGILTITKSMTNTHDEQMHNIQTKASVTQFPCLMSKYRHVCVFNTKRIHINCSTLTIVPDQCAL